MLSGRFRLKKLHELTRRVLGNLFQALNRAGQEDFGIRFSRRGRVAFIDGKDF